MSKSTIAFFLAVASNFFSFSLLGQDFSNVGPNQFAAVLIYANAPRGVLKDGGLSVRVFSLSCGTPDANVCQGYGRTSDQGSWTVTISDPNMVKVVREFLSTFEGYNGQGWIHCDLPWDAVQTKCRLGE